MRLFSRLMCRRCWGRKLKRESVFHSRQHPRFVVSGDVVRPVFARKNADVDQKRFCLRRHRKRRVVYLLLGTPRMRVRVTLTCFITSRCSPGLSQSRSVTRVHVLCAVDPDRRRVPRVREPLRRRPGPRGVARARTTIAGSAIAVSRRRLTPQRWCRRGRLQSRWSPHH